MADQRSWLVPGLSAAFIAAAIFGAEFFREKSISNDLTTVQVKALRHSDTHVQIGNNRLQGITAISIKDPKSPKVAADACTKGIITKHDELTPVGRNLPGNVFLFSFANDEHCLAEGASTTIKGTQIGLERLTGVYACESPSPANTANNNQCAEFVELSIGRDNPPFWRWVLIVLPVILGTLTGALYERFSRRNSSP